MRVLEPEPREQDLGVAVGPIVVVAIGVEQQVGRLADEHAPMPDGQRRGQVQALGEDLDRIGAAVAIGVLQDLDPVRAPHSPRRRLGHLVVLGPEILVNRHRLEPGRVGVLQILDDPEPPPLVEAGRHRLTHHRLGREDLDVEPLRDDHPLGRLLGREPAGRVGLLTARLDVQEGEEDPHQTSVFRGSRNIRVPLASIPPSHGGVELIVVTRAERESHTMDSSAIDRGRLRTRGRDRRAVSSRSALLASMKNSR